MEDMKYYLKGLSGQIEVYENRIVITRKGFNTFSLQGSGNKTIPIDAIKSIQLLEANSFHAGFIQFGIIGGIEAKGGLVNAAKDENTVTFSKKLNNDAKNIKDFLESKIFNKYKNSNQNDIRNFSTADEIIKYKKLLDDGIISQDEFNEKKKTLLDL